MATEGVGCTTEAQRSVGRRLNIHGISRIQEMTYGYL